MTPLYGHTSEETAYLVEDYPYGFKLRCKIKYWLESHPKKGFRFCSMTTNPKLSYESWNKPKRSTYMMIAANIFLDEKGHCTWSGVSEYTDGEQVVAFIKDFPLTNKDHSLLTWVLMKVAMYRKFADGSAHMGISINGVRQERTEEDKQRDMANAQKNLVAWEEALKLLRANQ
jgi:hypothetical protein